MRIALYTLSIDRTSGKEAAILELARRSAHDVTVLTSHFDAERTFLEFAELDVVDLAEEWLLRRIAKPRGLVRDACIHLPRLRLPLDGYDGLVVVSAGLEQLVTSGNRATPAAAFCLTPLRLAYDPAFRDAYRATRRFGSGKRALAAAFRAADGRAWNRFRRVLCISEEVRSRLIRGTRVDVSKTDVLYPGVRAEEVEPTWRYERFFLAPGRINWTKKLETAIEAFELLLSRSGGARDFHLVIAGMASGEDRDYLDSLKERAASEQRIRFVESPSDDELAALYRDCYAVLFCAVNEDFGIVPLEGMAYGKPVVCRDQGGPRETVVDGVTGLLVDEADGFADAMRWLVERPGLVPAMGHDAREHALGFDWSRFVERADEHLEESFGPAGAVG